MNRFDLANTLITFAVSITKLTDEIKSENGKRYFSVFMQFWMWLLFTTLASRATLLAVLLDNHFYPTILTPFIVDEHCE